jgi:hypothetical protein
MVLMSDGADSTSTFRLFTNTPEGNAVERMSILNTGTARFTGDITTGNILYVGTNTNDATPKTIYFGGTYNDNAYDHCVIENRIYASGTEKRELLLFSGNDIPGSPGPDRIRLRGAEINFDTYSGATTNRTAENIRMTINSAGNVGIGTTSPSFNLHVYEPDNSTAIIAATGLSQGTGVLFVGQSTTYGGGIAYNGDGSPNWDGSGQDYISLFRRADNAIEWTARNKYNSNNWEFRGAVSKSSGSFKIDHPLPHMKDTHNLYHSFIEGPQADNLYRGKVRLVNGRAEINIDNVSNMTEGTFVALNRDTQCFTTNETDWELVRGSLVGNILTIESQNTSSTATVSWLVIGERQDDGIKQAPFTDDDGKVVPEQVKTEMDGPAN